MKRTLNTVSSQIQSLEDRLHRSSQITPLKHLSAPGGCRIISFVNPFSFQILQQQPDLVAAVDDWYSDGILLCHTAGWGRGGPLPRYSFDFSSIAHEVFEHATCNGISVALLGGTEEEILLARAYLEDRYPGLNVTWSRNGYFRKDDENEGFAGTLAELSASGAGIVVIGMGTPLQEKVAVALKRQMQSEETGDRVIFTCGGFLSQTAQGGDYYPRIIKRTGMRWVYRAFRSRHVRQRLIVDYPRFLAQVAAYRLYRMLVSTRD